MYYNKKYNRIVPFFLLTLLLASPDMIYHFINQRWLDMVMAYGVCTALFTCPLFIFQGRLRLYTWLLLPFGILTIISLFCVIIYRVVLNFDVFLVILNTNFAEQRILYPHFF